MKLRVPCSECGHRWEIEATPSTFDVVCERCSFRFDGDATRQIRNHVLAHESATEPARKDESLEVLRDVLWNVRKLHMWVGIFVGLHLLSLATMFLWLWILWHYG